MTVHLGLQAMHKYLLRVEDFRKLVNRQAELRKESDEVQKELAAMNQTLADDYSTVQYHYPNIMPRRERYNESAYKVAELGDLVLKFYWQEKAKIDATGGEASQLFGVEA